MRKTGIFYLAIGFVIGVIWVSCNGAQIANTVASAITNAVDVVYDNTTSSLTAINVQAAIDELKSLLERKNLSSQLVGTWNGTVDEDPMKTMTLTLNADTTYSCTAEPESHFESSWGNPYCNSPISWRATKSTLVLIFDGQGSPSYLTINYIDEATMEIYLLNNATNLWSFTKS